MNRMAEASKARESSVVETKSLLKLSQQIQSASMMVMTMPAMTNAPLQKIIIRAIVW